MQSHSPLRQHLQQTQDGALYPQLPPELQGLQSNNAYQQQQYALSSGPPHPHTLHFTPHGLPHSPAQYQTFPVSATYHHVSSPRFAIANAPPAPLQHFHIPQGPHSLLHLPPTPLVHNGQQQAPQKIVRIQSPQLPPQQLPQQQEPQAHSPEETPSGGHGQFQGLKLIANPADLDAWRQKLFDVDDMITLTEEEFKTYFPHIDNIYSHRSTQRHKRKRFVSHYWDCRLKGRPPGTKKSTDPEKKKRKRVARERDLCDVKVKITEYFDQNEYEEQLGQKPPGSAEDNPSSPMVASTHGQTQQYLGQTWGAPPIAAPPTPSRKFYTFQRVNGNGGNGKGDGIAGPHKHSLEDSDRVKKNSVIRWLAKCEKEDRKNLQGGDTSKKTYHKKATGNALTTVKNHSKEDDLKLYGSAFCPFVQRVWISLEHKQIPYQYIEVDPYKKPQSLLDVNPRGLVPALRHGPTWSTHESTVIMEYLEDLNTGPALLPPDAQTRATSRLWADHINRNIIPWFYKLLQAQDQNDQVSHATELRNQISKLVDAAAPNGPFFLGPQISFVDVQIAPWVVRLRRVLGPYRGWPEAEEGTRWSKWI